MSAKTPAKVVATFQKRLNSLLILHRQLLQATENNVKEASLHSHVTEGFVLLSVISWEAFIHDLLVAFIEDDPSKFVADLRERMRAALEQKFGTSAMRVATLKRPKKTHLKQLADPKGWNITAKTSAEMNTLAVRYLPAPAAQKFSLSSHDETFLNFLIALRNYLSHHSTQSRDTLKDSIDALDVVPTAGGAASPNAPLKGTMKDIASYLKHEPAGSPSRAILICQRMNTLAGQLV